MGFSALARSCAGYRLVKVTRSDGEVLNVGQNVWQTTKVFAEGNQSYVDSPRLQLFDYNGTGDYTLEYVLDDQVPPQLEKIDSVTPDPRTTPVDTVTVEFSEPIDLSTFDWHDVTLQRNGQNVPLSSAVTVTPVAGTTTVYSVGGLTTFTAQDGAYRITVSGAGIQDYGANPGTGIQSVTWSKGDAPAYIRALGPVTPDPRMSSVDTVDVTFSKMIDPSSFDRNDLSLTVDATLVPLSPLVTVSSLGGATYRISGLDTLDTADGAYALTVDASGIKDTIGAAGLGSGTVTWTTDTVAPSIASVQTIATNPRNIVVQSVDVTFSEPIDLSSLDRSDLTLKRDGVAIPLDERITVEAVSGPVYRVKGINWFVGAEGNYSLSINAATIKDLAGNNGTGTASTSWLMDTTSPLAPTGLEISPDRGVSAVDGLTNTGVVTLSGQLSESGLNVYVFDTTLNAELGTANTIGKDFSIALSLSSGSHHLRLYTVDLAGNSYDSDFSISVDLTPPVVTQVVKDSTPVVGPAVDAVDVVFSKSIDQTSFTSTDVTLTRDGGAVPVDGAFTVVLVAGTTSTYRLGGLADLTRIAGTYILTVNAARVLDLAGNSGLGSGRTQLRSRCVLGRPG